MRALIVDDSKLQRKAMERLARELGIESDLASDGLAGLESLRSKPDAYELAIIDWNMPVMSGLELVQALRSDARFTHIAILMATTEDSLERIQAALEAGADEYLIKPFGVEELASKIELLGLDVAGDTAP